MKNNLVRNYVGAIALVISGIALAKVWGPFLISAAGPDYASTSLNDDAVAEYGGANKLAQIYLAPALNTPAAIAKAIKNDFVRVVYYDGQIADFKIKRWPSTIPVDFDSTVPTVTTVHLSDAQVEDIDARNNRCQSISYSISYDTGYWGQYGTNNGSTVTITAYYVDTGTRTMTFPGTVNCQYR